MAGDRWWKGERGEWYVVAQFVVFSMIIFAPRGDETAPGPWQPLRTALRLSGAILLAAGGIMTAAGFLSLGGSVAILPRPRKDGELVVSGAYRLVRHPIYSGLFFASVGWWLWNRTLFLMFCVMVLFAVLDLKARREERWLVERFPRYADYRKRVKRLIPFLY